MILELKKIKSVTVSAYISHEVMGPDDLFAAAAKSLQSCPTLCDPIDGSPPGSPVPGIFQTRTLEWGAIAFSEMPCLVIHKTRSVTIRLLFNIKPTMGKKQLERNPTRNLSEQRCPVEIQCEQDMLIFNFLGAAFILKSKYW